MANRLPVHRFLQNCYHGGNDSYHPHERHVDDYRRENQYCPAARNGSYRACRCCNRRIRIESEVIRDALRDWTYKRSLRMQGIVELRAVWQEMLSDKTPGISANDVLNRLERKYQTIANAGG